MQFKIVDVTKITAVKRLRLNTWLALGFLQPSIRGQQWVTPHLFSREDVYKIELFKKLTEGGFSRELAASYVQYFSDENLETNIFSKDLKCLYLFLFRKDGLVFDFETVFEGFGTEMLILKFKDPEFDDVLGINISKLVNTIDNKIKALGM